MGPRHVASFATATYMELGLKSCPPSFTVRLLQLLNGTDQSRGWDLCVPTGEGLQNSIMDEHILLLDHRERIMLRRVLVYKLMVCMRVV